jgi:hypothetical protein
VRNLLSLLDNRLPIHAGFGAQGEWSRRVERRLFQKFQNKRVNYIAIIWPSTYQSFVPVLVGHCLGTDDCPRLGCYYNALNAVAEKCLASKCGLSRRCSRGGRSG